MGRAKQEVAHYTRDLFPETVTPPPRIKPIADDLPPTRKQRLFTIGLKWLNENAGKDCRAVLGKWVSKHGVDPVADAVNEAIRNKPGDPIPYITRILLNGSEENFEEQGWGDQVMPC